MSGVVPVHECGPITYDVAATKVVTGGQLVEAVSGGTVQPAAAGSKKVLGVATRDARADQTDTGTTAYGQPFTDYSWPPPRVAVAHEGTWRLTYAAAANFGDLLKAAANGQVTPINTTGGDTLDMVVGQCRERGNVASGATGETLLKLS